MAEEFCKNKTSLMISNRNKKHIDLDYFLGKCKYTYIFSLTLERMGWQILDCPFLVSQYIAGWLP